MKLNPPNAHRSQIKICEKRQTKNVQFRFMPNAFRILKPIQKSSKTCFECFVTQVQTRLANTKRVWPMKINVMCTVRIIFCKHFRLLSALTFSPLVPPLRRHSVPQRSYWCLRCGGTVCFAIFFIVHGSIFI